MSGLHLDASGMNTQGTSTVASAETFSSEINNLSSNVDSLMSIWRGLAATTFKSEVDQQIANLNEFKEILNLLGEKIMQGARLFDQTEEENASEHQIYFYRRNYEQI